MNTELLSVVDKNDQVIDTQPRDIIHNSELMHRAVHILIFNSRKELFLQKRSMKKDLNKGLWDTSAAGHVDAGEQYIHAAIRETEEELGVDINNMILPLFKLSPTKQLGMEFIWVYQCINDEPLTLNADEIETGDWLTVKEISKRVLNNDLTMTETFKIIWQKYSGEYK